MKKSLVFILCLSLITCNKEKLKNKNINSVKIETHKDSNGFTYETVTNDPTGLRLYTLENGLKVYLSKNSEEPKIQTYIAVRTGSNYDPKQSTGLAHYLEHMMFKGTHKIGTLDWEKEKIYLQKISDLYEKHRAEKDPKKKKEIYKEIDKVSLEASKYAVANEYDKLISSLGATETNAHTWFEETIYKNKIPANELNKWLTLEHERFSTLVLRLFHTELEAVFEEFNMGQDNDFRKSYTSMLDGLFPKHPYGQQTTIGKGEHLKNPSMVDIHNYFNTYYVPNNMAIVLVGDLEFDQTIKKVNDTFGKMKAKELKHPELPKEDPITKPIIKEVFGPTNEAVSLSFRTNSVNSEDRKYITLCDMILTNGHAGLIDLNLNQKQLVQKAGSSALFLNDYGFHVFNANPKQGQSLEQTKDLLLEQIENLKKGNFDDWMMEAVINDLKLSQTRNQENSTALATAYYNAFIHHVDWKDEVKFLNELKKISKKELVDFANKFYKNNYVVVYKRKGKDKNTYKVENPNISPVHLNRGKMSDFVKNFLAVKSDKLQAKFIDYDKEIKETKINSGIEISYINNPNNDLFELDFIFDMGRNSNKKLALASKYLNYLGTDKYTAEELKKEFYKLGISYFTKVLKDKTYLGIKGLKENLAKGLELLNHLYENAKVDHQAYQKYLDKIEKSRMNMKTDKREILWGGLYNYARYGEHSEYRNIYTSEELKNIKPEELVTLIKDLKNYKQRIFYYGKDINHVVETLNNSYNVPKKLKEYPKKETFVEQKTGGNVYFVNYDMVQVEMILLAKKGHFDTDELAISALFNSYFGSGLSSIVFQEIRESKSLAYSAFAGYRKPRKKEDANYTIAYIGTQANKLQQATEAMIELMNNLPKSENQFNASKKSALKKIEAERITKTNIFWNYENLKKLGINYDIRKDIYEDIKKLTFEDLQKFFDKNIKNSKFDVLLIGNKNNLDTKLLSKFGKVQELDIDYLFNYKK